MITNSTTVSKSVQMTIIMATITLALALFAVGSEAAMQEEDAEVFVVPALYALILTSGITVATGTAGLIERQQKIDSIK